MPTGNTVMYASKAKLSPGISNKLGGLYNTVVY